VISWVVQPLRPRRQPHHPDLTIVLRNPTTGIMVCARAASGHAAAAPPSRAMKSRRLRLSMRLPPRCHPPS